MNNVKYGLIFYISQKDLVNNIYLIIINISTGITNYLCDNIEKKFFNNNYYYNEK